MTIDSAPLHLARACPTLPVIALTNDQPILWKGSSWQPNWAWCCRYHDWPERAVEMLGAIETCRKETKRDFVTVLNHYDYQHDPVVVSGLLPVSKGACGRDSASVLGDSKRIPYLKDCLRMGLQRAKDEEHVCLMRPDVFLINPPDKSFLKHDACYAYRMQEVIGKTRNYIPVLDMFSARKRWWKEVIGEIPDFVFGSDYFWSRSPGRCSKSAELSMLPAFATVPPRQPRRPRRRRGEPSPAKAQPGLERGIPRILGRHPHLPGRQRTG